MIEVLGVASDGQSEYTKKRKTIWQHDIFCWRWHQKFKSLQSESLQSFWGNENLTENDFFDCCQNLNLKDSVTEKLKAIDIENIL